MEKRIKIFVAGSFVVFAVAVLLFIGVLLYVKVLFSGQPVVYSDGDTKNAKKLLHDELVSKIQNSFQMDLPENAKDLYYASRGSFMGFEQYAAFSLESEQECENYLGGVDGLEKGGLGSSIFSGYLTPDKWGAKYQNEYWGLNDEDVFLFKNRTAAIDVVVYEPKGCRVYLFWQAGP